MPGANNVASAKTVGTSTKAAAEAIALSFNTAIKYICDNIKTEAFAKGLDKKIDSFCKSTQKSITKLFSAFTFSSKMLKEAEKSDRAVNIIQGFTSKLASIKVPKDLDKTMKSVADSVNAAKAILECIADIAKQSLLVSLLIVPALLGLVEMKLFIKAISWLATSISKIKIDEDKIKAILSMRDMVKAIMQIALISALFILIAPIAIVGLLAMLTFILAVKLLSMVLNLIKISEDSINSVLSLEKMVKAILKVAMISALFILIAPFAILGLVGMILFVAALGLMGLLLKIVAPLFSEMKDEVKKILKIVTYLLLAAMVICLFLVIAPFLLKAMFVVLLFVMGLVPIAIFLKIVIEIFDQVKWGDMLKLLAMIAITLVIAFMLVIIGELGNATSIGGLILFGIGLLILTVGAVIATFMTKIVGYGDIIKLLVIVVLMLAISFMIVMISKLGDQISWSGMGWFGLALLAIIGVTIALGVLMATGFGAAALVLGLVAVAIFAGAAGMLLLAGLAMVKMSEIADKIDDTAFAKIVGSIINGFKEMFTSENMAFLNPISLFFIMGSIVELTMIVGAIGLMAGILQDIASMKIPTEFDSKGKPTAFKVMTSKDFMDAAQNAGSIIEFFGKMFTGGGQLTNGINVPDLTPFLDVDLSWGVKIKFRRLKNIVGYIGEMAETLQDIASLRIPLEFNADGKAIKYKRMEKEDFISACDSAGAIITFFAKLFTDKTIDAPDGSKIQNPVAKILDEGTSISWFAKRRFARIADIVGYVGEMATVLQKIASMNMPIEWDKDGKVTKYEKMQPSDFRKYGENVKDILDTLISAVSSDTIKDMILLGIADCEDAFKNLGLLVSPISGMVDIITNLTSLQVPQADAKGSILKDDEGNIIYRMFNLKDELPVAMNQVELLTEGLIDLGKYAAQNIGEELDDGDFEDALNNLNLLVTPISTMVDMISNIAVLKVPNGYNDNGEASGFHILNASDIDTANRNIRKISDGLLGMFVDVVNGKLYSSGIMWKLQFIGEESDSINDGMNALSSIVSSLGEAAKIYSENASLQTGDTFAGLSSNFGEVVYAVSKFKDIDAKAVTMFDNVALSVQKFGALGYGGAKENIGALTNFIQKINDTSLDKLKSAADMMRNIAELSKSISGNFDKLADALNEKLITILEELKEILEKASNEIKEHHENNPGGSGSSNSAGNGKDKDFAKAPGKEEQNKDKKIDLSETNRRIGEVTSAINRLYNEISGPSGYFGR